MNWKVVVTLLLILSATAIATTTICQNTPKLTHGQLGAPERKALNRNSVLYGDPIDGPGGPH